MITLTRNLTHSQRLAEASPEALAEYQEKLAKLLKDSDALDEKVLVYVKGLIAKMRAAVLVKVAEAQAQESKEGKPSWGPYWVPLLVKEFTEVIQEIGRQFSVDLSSFGIQSYVIGSRLADEGLDLALENRGSKKAPGILISELPKLDPELIKIGSGFSADLITQMEREQIKTVSKEVVTSVSLGEPPGKLISRLAGMVNKGPWKTVQYRAEIIARTEIARIQELARKQRLLQQQKAFPGIKLYQQWLVAPINGWPCKKCDSYDGFVWDTQGKAHLPPEAPDMPDLPLHPNCRCTLIPWIDDQDYVQDEEQEAMAEALAEATWNSDAEPPTWEALLPNGGRYPLIPTPGQWNIEPKTPDQAPDSVIIGDVMHLAAMKGVRVDRVEVNRNASAGAGTSDPLPRDVHDATDEQLDQFIDWIDLQKANLKAKSGNWMPRDFKMHEMIKDEENGLTKPLWDIFKAELQKPKMRERLTGEKPKQREEATPSLNLYNYDQTLALCRWMNQKSIETMKKWSAGGTSLTPEELEIEGKISAFTDEFPMMTNEETAKQIVSGKASPKAISLLSDLWPMFHSSQKSEEELAPVFSPPKRGLVWSNKDQLWSAMKKAQEIFRHVGSRERDVSGWFNYIQPLPNHPEDNWHALLDDWSKFGKKLWPKALVEYIENAHLAGYSTTTTENVAAIKTKAKKEKKPPEYNGPIGSLYVNPDKQSVNSDTRNLLQLINLWGENKKIGSLLSKIKTAQKKWLKNKLTFEEMVAQIEDALSHSFIKKQFNDWKNAPVTDVETKMIAPVVDRPDPIIDTIKKSPSFDPDDILAKELHEALNAGLTPEEQKLADIVAKAGFDVQADIKHKLQNGQVIEFKKGQPPTWAPAADLLGFPAYAIPETKQGAKDGQLPVTHWKIFADEIYEDPAKLKKSYKSQSAGVVMLEEDGVWLVEPWNHHGGYVHIFPKGGVESGLTHQQSAMKECWEETGIEPELCGYLGEYEKTSTKTKYYIGTKSVGQPWAHGWETEAVKLVPWNKVEELLNQSTASGKAADIQVFKDLQAVVAKAKDLIAKPGYSKLTIPQAIKVLNQLEKKEAERKAQAAAAAAAAAAIAQQRADAKAQALAAAQVKAKAQALIDGALQKLGQDTLSEDQLEFYAPKTKGGNPGGFYSNKVTGQKYLVKKYTEKEQAYTEKAANSFYEILGINAPKNYLVSMQDGTLGLASELVENLDDNNGHSKLVGVMNGPDSKAKEMIGIGFGLDAFLANWDVVGMNYDNLVLTKDLSAAWRIDNGGSLDFRAVAGRKGSAFSNDVPELDSMRKKYQQSSAVFGKANDKDILKGLEMVAGLSDDVIRHTIYSSGFETKEAERIIEILLNRRNFIRGKLSVNVLSKSMPAIKRIQSILGECKGLDGYQEMARLEYQKQTNNITNPTPKDYKQEHWLAKKGTITKGFKPENTYNRSRDQSGLCRWLSKKRDAELSGYVDRSKISELRGMMSTWQGAPAGCKKYFDNLLAATKGGSIPNPDLWEAQTASYSCVQSSLQPGEKITLFRGSNNSSASFNVKEIIGAWLHGRRKIGVTVRIASGWATDYNVTNDFAQISEPWSGGNQRPDNTGFIFKKEFEPEQILGGWGLTPGFAENSYSYENEFIVLADDCDPSQATRPGGYAWENGKVYLDLETEVFCNLWGPDHPQYKNFSEFKKSPDFERFLRDLGYGSGALSPEEDIKKAFESRFGPSGQGMHWKESVQRLIESLRLIEASLASVRAMPWTDDCTRAIQEQHLEFAGQKALEVLVWHNQGIVWETDELEVDWLQELRKQEPYKSMEG